MRSVLTLDPGESTGWCFRSSDGMVFGGTVSKNHLDVATLIRELNPTMVVYESFHLYPQMAKSLSWNSFYPCEVIGAIKLTCMQLDVPMLEQAPSVKKYFGGFQEDWKSIKYVPNDLVPYTRGVTEHTKDAYMHLKYFERNWERKHKN